MDLSSYRPYYPAGIAMLLGLFFLLVPSLAVFLVVGALFSFSLLYAFIVYKFRTSVKEAGTFESTRDEFSSHSNSWSESEQEPTFKNVTVYMIKKGNWFERA